ncbi:MAG: hypothetical protein HQL70_03455 [Magnetococcales bacterium]|nr:hypothetical protein [Magnetococcales bacterium]
MSNISVGSTLAAQLANSQQALNEEFNKFDTRTGQVTDRAVRLSLSERFNAEVQKINQATLNVNDGITVVQIADYGLEQIQNRQLRLQELAVLSDRGTLPNGQDHQNVQGEQRRAINGEAEEIQKEITAIIANTKYNNINLLTTNDKLSIQTGPTPEDQSAIKLTNYTNRLTEVDLSSRAGTKQALATLKIDMEQVRTSRSEMAATESKLSALVPKLTDLSQTLSIAGSAMRDVDIYNNSSQQAAANILANANEAIKAQANQFSARAFQLLQ